MNENLKSAYKLFEQKKYNQAKEIFIQNNLTYEAGFCCLLTSDLLSARKYFELKQNDCTASNFGIIILDLIEDKIKYNPKYFQVRSFLELYINLLIENKLFDWAQKIIDNYEFFTRFNMETPKFIARVLDANGYLQGAHSFCKLGYEICFFDAEIHYIEASIFIKEREFENAKKCIENCKGFASDYYPILRLEGELNRLIS